MAKYQYPFKQISSLFLSIYQTFTGYEFLGLPKILSDSDGETGWATTLTTGIVDAGALSYR